MIKKVKKSRKKKSSEYYWRFDQLDSSKKCVRKRIKIYHSLTHLIHSALRAILGKHVTQKGSLVSFNKLRFDFSHPRSLENNEIKKIEMIVNKIIKQDDTVNIFITSYKKAVGKGAMALFGEKYDDEVRVVSMGKNLNNSIFSIELCGGTHVNKTSEIESLKITKESSVSSGIRRIEAISGIDILKYSKEQKKNVLEKEKDSIKKKLEEKLSEKKTKITLQDKSKNLIFYNSHLDMVYFRIQNLHLIKS